MILQDTRWIPYYRKKIKCPLHHVVIPGRHAFKIVPNELAKSCTLTDAELKRFGIRKWKYARDRFGNKIPDYNNHYQPEISAAFAIEHIYDPLRPLCQKCRKCLEGSGSINLAAISRLKGE